VVALILAISFLIASLRTTPFWILAVASSGFRISPAHCAVSRTLAGLNCDAEPALEVSLREKNRYTRTPQRSSAATKTAPKKTDRDGRYFALDCSCSSIGSGSGVGMVIATLHFGHFTRFPAASSGAVKRDEQLGHIAAIDMM